MFEIEGPHKKNRDWAGHADDWLGLLTAPLNGTPSSSAPIRTYLCLLL